METGRVRPMQAESKLMEEMLSRQGKGSAGMNGRRQLNRQAGAGEIMPQRRAGRKHVRSVSQAAQAHSCCKWDAGEHEATDGLSLIRPICVGAATQNTMHLSNTSIHPFIDSFIQTCPSSIPLLSPTCTSEPAPLLPFPRATTSVPASIYSRGKSTYTQIHC